MLFLYVFSLFFFFFFFNDTATTEIYTLSLHDALPIWEAEPGQECTDLLGGDARLEAVPGLAQHGRIDRAGAEDRKSTRLNSSHGYISYAVFCLKKKKKKQHKQIVNSKHEHKINHTHST